MSSAKTFDIPVADGIEAADVLQRAKDAARGAGIAITGDEAGGRFEGTAEGTYSVDAVARMIRVEVTAKPGFVPWSMVERALHKVFS